MYKTWQPGAMECYTKARVLIISAFLSWQLMHIAVLHAQGDVMHI